MPSEWFSTLNSNGDGLAALAAIITGTVAVLTLIRASWDSRDRTRPVVLAEYRVPPYASKTLELVIRNAGVSPARNLKVDLLNVPPSEKRGQVLRQFVLRRYKEPIPMLGPGQELVNAVVCDQESEDNSDLPHEFTITVEYNRGWFRKWRDEFTLRSDVYMNHTSSESTTSPTGRLKQIRDHLKGIRSALEELTHRHEAADTSSVKSLIEKLTSGRSSD